MDGWTLVFAVIDNVGYFYEQVESLRAEAKERFGVEELVFSSTHDHESVDTIGLWGVQYGDDGKTPRYMEFLRAKILEAIGEAVASLEPAVLRTGQGDTPRELLERSRPPVVVDQAATALQALRPDGTAIGTLVAWGVHTESLGSRNRLLTSDFPHYLREAIEAEFGGVAVFAEGAIGAVGPGDVGVGGFERARIIGEAVAGVASAALQAAPTFVPSELGFESRPFYFQASNTFLLALNAAGVFDRQTYECAPGTQEPAPAAQALCVPSAERGTWLKTEVAVVTLGPLQLATVPGELFPELALGGSFPPTTDCPGPANPQILYREPVIKAHMTGAIKGILGVTADLLGYIVPLNDFVPPDFTQLLSTQDIEGQDRCGRSHYNETVSADRELAPAVMEGLRELLTP